MKITKLNAWALLLILSVIWGSSYILIKIGLQDHLGNARIPALQLGALRMSIAFLVLSPFLVKAFKVVKKKDIPFLLLSGVFGNGLPAFLYAYAESHLDSIITGMLNALVPLFTLIIAAGVFKFKIKLTHIIGIIIGVFGAFLIVFEKIGSLSFSSSDLMPLFAVIFATVCYAISLNVIKYKLKDLTATTITSVSFLFVGPFCIFYILTSDFFTRVTSQPDFQTGVVAVAILAVLGTAIAVLLFNKLVKISTPVFASSVTYFIPVIAICLGLIYGETVNTIQLFGMVVLILGVLVINKNK